MDILMLRRFAVLALLAASVGSVAACKPDLDQRASELGDPVRVLAVRAEPAEGAPSAEVTFRALVVDGSGALIASPDASWGYCTARKPLAELGPVSPACYTPGSDTFTGLGRGVSVTSKIPTSACRDFGPEVPQAKPGEPYGRPVDADPSGGYYQPVTVVTANGGDSVTAVDTTRISCGVSGATSEDVIAFRQRYHLNTNPEVSSLVINGAAVVDETTPVVVPLGARVVITTAWPACPAVDTCGDAICGPDETASACGQDCSKPVGCTGAERYLGYDAEARLLVVRREAIRVSWFASNGAFEQDRSGRDALDLATAVDNVWVAPSVPGLVHGWVVLRDERGGTSWRGFTVDVH